MGQVIRLVFPDSGYPATMQELDTAECVFLLAVRWWVADHREDIDPLPRLCDAMAIAGTPDAAFLVDRLMAALARATRRTILIHCPHCPQVGEDEKHLLHAAASFRRANPHAPNVLCGSHCFPHRVPTAPWVHLNRLRRCSPVQD